MLQCNIIILVCLVYANSLKYYVGAYSSPVLILGGNCPEKPSLRIVTKNEFQQTMEILLKDRMLIAFIESELSLTDFQCVNPYSGKNCFPFLSDVNPITYYNQVESPSLVLMKSLKAPFIQDELDTRIGSEYLKNISCKTGSVHSLYFTNDFDSRWETLTMHDTIMRRYVEGTDCDRVAFLYTNSRRILRLKRNEKDEDFDNYDWENLSYEENATLYDEDPDYKPVHDDYYDDSRIIKDPARHDENEVTPFGSVPDWPAVTESKNEKMPICDDEIFNDIDIDSDYYINRRMFLGMIKNSSDDPLIYDKKLNSTDLNQLATGNNDSSTDQFPSLPGHKINSTNLFFCSHFVIYFDKAEIADVEPPRTLKNRRALDIATMNCDKVNDHKYAVSFKTDGLNEEIDFDLIKTNGYYAVKYLKFHDLKIYTFDIQFPSKGFSYSCNKLLLGNSKYALIFSRLQMEVIDSKNPQTKFRFSEPWTCDAFITPGIVSGLFVMSILIGITSFSLIMMVNIQASDRFDNPNGKPLQIALD